MNYEIIFNLNFMLEKIFQLSLKIKNVFIPLAAFLTE